MRLEELAHVPGARRRVFYFLEAGGQKLEAGKKYFRSWQAAARKGPKTEERRDPSSLRSSGDRPRRMVKAGAFRWNRNQGSLTTERLASPRRELRADYGWPEGVMVWTITSSARVEQYCGTRRTLPLARRVRSRKPAKRVIAPREKWSRRNRGVETESGHLKVAATRLTLWVSFMVKLLRAYGGCLGARRR